jgi:flagellar biosynthesis anti-sigma factor FlgM
MAINNINSQNGPAPKHRPAANTDKAAASDAKKAGIVDAGLTNASNAAKTAAQTPTGAAGVQISPRAREINLARKIVDETPDIREDKVAKFKELIAKGEYKPDAANIADGVIKEAIRDELSKNDN